MKVIFFFWGGGAIWAYFWASCSEDQNMGSNESQMDIISVEMDYMTPEILDNVYHT